MERRDFLKTAASAVAGMVLTSLPSTLSFAQGAEPTGVQQAWRQIDPRQMTDNPFTLLRDDWLALAVGKRGSMNAMTISWGALGSLWGELAVTVYVEPRRYTHQFMEQNECFTVTAFSEQYRKALEYIGSRSGRDEKNKLARAGLTAGYTELGNPILNEGRLAIECRKIYAAPFDVNGMGEKGRSMYGRTGMRPHTVFVGEVINMFVK